MQQDDGWWIHWWIHVIPKSSIWKLLISIKMSDKQFKWIFSYDYFQILSSWTIFWWTSPNSQTCDFFHVVFDVGIFIRQSQKQHYASQPWGIFGFFSFYVESSCEFNHKIEHCFDNVLFKSFFLMWLTFVPREIAKNLINHYHTIIFAIDSWLFTEKI